MESLSTESFKFRFQITGTGCSRGKRHATGALASTTGQRQEAWALFALVEFQQLICVSCGLASFRRDDSSKLRVRHVFKFQKIVFVVGPQIQGFQLWFRHKRTLVARRSLTAMESCSAPDTPSSSPSLLASWKSGQRRRHRWIHFTLGEAGPRSCADRFTYLSEYSGARIAPRTCEDNHRQWLLSMEQLFDERGFHRESVSPEPSARSLDEWEKDDGDNPLVLGLVLPANFLACLLMMALVGAVLRLDRKFRLVDRVVCFICFEAIFSTSIVTAFVSKKAFSGVYPSPGKTLCQVRGSESDTVTYARTHTRVHAHTHAPDTPTYRNTHARANLTAMYACSIDLLRIPHLRAYLVALLTNPPECRSAV